ncbi:MAG: hypothetical protein ACOY5B_17065 [Spirochaetota bacterium]
MRRVLLIPVFAGLLASPLAAEKLPAGDFSGAGSYEYLFFPAGRQAEAQELARRITELAEEEKRIANELSKAEAEIAAVEDREEKKKPTRIDWSDIESVTGYSVKLYDAEKKLLSTHTTEDNFIVLELVPADYHFQVAAVTKYKTGAYSRMTRLKVSKGKPSDQRLKAEEAAEALREKQRLTKKFREGHAETLRTLATSRETTNAVPADLKVPDTAASYLVAEQGGTARYSQVMPLPGRQLTAGSRSASYEPTSNYLWGAGILAGIQDTRLDYFRVTLGAEAFVRYDKPFFRFFYPQLKFMSGVSPGRESAFDAMVHSQLYAGAYYPIEIGRGFRLLGSLTTGPNVFFVLSSAASGTAVQWGVMPSVELQYQLWERTSIYMGAGINFTFDPNGVLRFIPLSVGITRHF